MLELQKVCFKYPQFTLSADFTIARGICCALTGVSGSGKSTLINIIAGFISPDSGSILFDNNLLNKLAPADRPLTVLFQSGNLFEHLTVWQNIALGLDPGLKLDDKQLQMVTNALNCVGLEKFKGRKPGSLSGGQQQRVALARCFARSHPLLLLDEPFNALNSELRNEMLSIVSDLQLKYNMTVLMVTHHIEEVQHMVQNELTIIEGQVVSY